MSLTSLSAISPIDGRYQNKTVELEKFFSEAALIRYRLKIEIEYFIALCKLPLPRLSAINKNSFSDLRAVYLEFGLAEAQKIKELERVTNHDVKAVEYYLKERFIALGLEEFQEFIHFGLTSQDINNTAIPLSLKDALTEVYVPVYQQVLQKIEELSELWSGIPMLARTHGQPASPTCLGKELQVFAVRLKQQFDLLNNIPSAAKFGGATGNFNAHVVAYPNTDWFNFALEFTRDLGLQLSFPTTQIEHYDHLAALFDALKRINTILTDFCRDLWTYISMDYFKQTINKNEVGSSTMPHKVNPIDFENAEGNLGLANAIFQHLAVKLPVSRLQRDLTDSTVLRNIGVPLAHTLVAFKSILKGLDKLKLNKMKLQTDLNENWAVVAEAIQTILRRELYPKPYEALKELTRSSQTVDKEAISRFVNSLKLSDEIKAELLAITPMNYTGIC